MANLVFFVIFALEMILKLYAMGIRGYVSDRFNVFDGIIVILSTLELILTYAAAGLGTGGVISAFRALRLLRVFKLAKNWPTLQALIEAMTKTLADISYFAILMFLFIFIFALLGMEFFAHNVKLSEDDKPDRYGESPRENFDDFFHAFVTIFVILVGDDWQFVYYHSSRAVGPASLVYFLMLVVLGNFILLNLFLAILLGNFDPELTDEELERAKERQAQKAKDQEELDAEESLQ